MSDSIRRSLPTPPPPPSPLYFRLLRSIVGVTVFLLGFAVALLALLHWYFLPALAASAHADAIQKRELALHAILLLVTLLALLLIWLMVIFQVRNWFTATSDRRGKPTNYPDAWTESARRLQPPPEEGESDVFEKEND